MMNKIIASLLLCFSCVCSAANSVNIIYDTGFQQPFMLPATTINIDGQNVPIMIDLGFSGGDADIILKRKIAKELGIVGHPPVHYGYSQSGKTRYLTATLPSVIIGQQTFYNVKAWIAQSDWGGGTKYKHMKKGASFKNGVITFHFLQKYNVLFKFQQHKMILYHPKKSLPKKVNQWNKLTFMRQNGLSTSIVLEKKSINLVWDTAFTPSVIDQQQLSPDKLITCALAYQHFGKTPKCYNLKSLHYHQFWVTDIGLPPQVNIAGVVGGDFFATHNVFIDFRHQKLYWK
jgi:hypothetical protein